MIKWKDRNKPEVFKPLIDFELVEMASLNGHMQDIVRPKIEAVRALDYTNIGYLIHICRNIAAWCYKGNVESIMKEYALWSINLFESPDEVPVLAKPSQNGSSDYFFQNVVFPERYPKKARAALMDGLFIGGGNGDVLGVWNKDGINKIYVAFPDAFEILANDPVEWIQDTRSFVEKRINGTQ
jgi:hypothetical protein